MDRESISDNGKNVLWVVGDSTLYSSALKYYYPPYGYGSMLERYMDDTISVINIALPGRSSKSYTKEPEYTRLINNMKKGDFLLVGFGHNDEKKEPERYTCADGEYYEEGSFSHSVYQKYIVPANERGVTVILCTPVVRRTPDGIWKDEMLHKIKSCGKYQGGDYAAAIIRLGKKKNVYVIDMTSISRKLYDDMGYSETKYLHAWTSDKDSSVDNTHTNMWGACIHAYNVLQNIKAMKIAGISEHIITDKCDFPDRDKILKSNPLYKPVIYVRPSQDSNLWEQMDGFSGTIFGNLCMGDDVDDKALKDSFILEKDSYGNMHIAVKNNKGKISDNTDGIAMYYKRIKADNRFCLSAKMRINDYLKNNQVSFGLMVRDDIYIDKCMLDIPGDYVAAAPLMLSDEGEEWNCYARKDGRLISGGVIKNSYKPGDVAELKIESLNDGYTCTFGNEQTVSEGFDFKLTRIDSEYIYAGMFAARNADVTFMDIKLEYI